MPTLRNFEALFIATVGLACAASHVIETDLPAAGAPATAQASPARAMPVVVVSAKRLTAAQKMQSQASDKAAREAAATSRI